MTRVGSQRHRKKILQTSGLFQLKPHIRSFVTRQKNIGHRLLDGVDNSMYLYSSPSLKFI